MKNLFSERRIVIQYLRDRKRNPLGVAIVYRSNKGALMVGYSKWHKDDRYDRRTGLYQALQRARPMNEMKALDFDVMPHGIAALVNDTMMNARRYFSPVKPCPRKVKTSDTIPSDALLNGTVSSSVTETTNGCVKPRARRCVKVA